MHRFIEHITPALSGPVHTVNSVVGQLLRGPVRERRHDGGPVCQGTRSAHSGREDATVTEERSQLDENNITEV